MVSHRHTETTSRKKDHYERLRPTDAGRTARPRRKPNILSQPQHEIQGTSWSRHELKYFITEAQAAAIKQSIAPFMKLDKYCRNQPSQSYPIVSLYLDSKDMRLCRESVTGDKNRFKLRIRSYTDASDYPRFFEIKRRVGTIIIKSRTRVFEHSIPELLAGRFPPPEGNDLEEQALRQFLLYARTIGAGPLVRVRYRRQAFVGKVDKRVRITLDRDLCTNPTSVPTVELNGMGWRPLRLRGVILEIKFTGQYPPWIGRMVRYYNLRAKSISKYVNCVKQACLLGFCAPKIPMYSL